MESAENKQRWDIKYKMWGQTRRHVWKSNDERAWFEPGLHQVFALFFVQTGVTGVLKKIFTLGVFTISVCVFLWPKTLFARRWKAQKHRKLYIIKNTPTSTEAGWIRCWCFNLNLKLKSKRFGRCPEIYTLSFWYCVMAKNVCMWTSQTSQHIVCTAQRSGRFICCIIRVYPEVASPFILSWWLCRNTAALTCCYVNTWGILDPWRSSDTSVQREPWFKGSPHCSQMSWVEVRALPGSITIFLWTLPLNIRSSGTTLYLTRWFTSL